MEFFDKEAQAYFSSYDWPFFFDWLKDQRGPNDAFSLLDIGGGNGAFAKKVLKVYPRSSIVVIDPSTTMLNMVDDPRIEKIKGMLPNKLNYRKIADYIHISLVLHHITGSSPSKSLGIMTRSLELVYNLLKPGECLCYARSAGRVIYMVL